MASKKPRFVDRSLLGGGDVIDQVTRLAELAEQRERDAGKTRATEQKKKNAPVVHGESTPPHPPATGASPAGARTPVGVSLYRESPQRSPGSHADDLEGPTASRTETGQPTQPVAGSAGTPTAPPVGGSAEDAAQQDSQRSAVNFWVSDGGYGYQAGERSYELKPLDATATSTRMRLRLTHHGRRHFDSLDLISSRARRSFALEVQRIWDIPAAAIEGDLAQIIDRIERERAKVRSSQGPNEGRSATELSHAEREAGLALLRSPDLIERIISDIEALGYVGEANASVLVYLAATSRKLSSPLSVIIVSESSSGKSYLVDTVRRMMPPDEVVAVTSLSDQALNYLDDLRHKFLILGEAVHSEAVEHQIREMLSAKELRRLVTVKDAESGRMVSRMVSKEVVVASVMSGTSYRLNPENASRCFVIGTDESEEQTKRIHAAQRAKHTLAGITRKREVIPAILNHHRAAQVLLEPIAVVNPFAEQLDFPAHRMRLRRDHERFLDLIAAIAFLRQYQKQRTRSGDLEYLEADLSDYRIAYDIMAAGVLEQTLREMPKGATRLLHSIREYVAARAEADRIETIEVSFTQRALREATGAGHSWLKQNLRVLVEYEYIDITRGGSSRTRGFYRLTPVREVARTHVQMIPSPEELAKWVG